MGAGTGVAVRAGRALAALMVATAAGALAPGDARAQPRVRAEPVADRVWMVQGESALGSTANRNHISNAGFVATRDGVVVVDALGSPALAEELLAEIERLTRLPVTHVIVTHYHADHVYGLQALKARGASVIAHASGREYLNSETARRRLEASRDELAPWIDASTRLVPADRWLEGDAVLEVGGERIEIRHAGPSHTAEDLVVFVPRTRTLFVGDLVFRGRIPFVGQADSRRWIAALDRLLDDRPLALVPGHGPVSRDPVPDLQTTRDYLRHLRVSMARAARELEPFEDAYARTDWSRFERLPLFGVANRINAYNTYLLMEQGGEP
ncbi:MAG TPA: MBL fold metallo-hydrolase [Burkholderiaceae bacterium]|nr:MBL fold metallo-hydrolase [Burkholderiaceae bacterium]